MKTRTKKLLLGAFLGVLLLGWYGSSQDKKEALAALDRGEEALKTQQWDSAADAFSESLKKSEIYSTLLDEQVRAHLGRGTALAMLEQPAAAEQAFLVAYSLSPLSAPSTGEPLVVAASEKARKTLTAQLEEATQLAESVSLSKKAKASEHLPASSTHEELLGILNQVPDGWTFQDLRINARGEELWMEFDLKRQTLGFTSDQVRAQAALLLAHQSTSLEEVYGATHVLLKCEQSTGAWSIQNMQYARGLLRDKETLMKGANLLISMMQ